MKQNNPPKKQQQTKPIQVKNPSLLFFLATLCHTHQRAKIQFRAHLGLETTSPLPGLDSLSAKNKRGCPER